MHFTKILNSFLSSSYYNPATLDNRCFDSNARKGVHCTSRTNCTNARKGVHCTSRTNCTNENSHFLSEKYLKQTV